MNAEPFIIMDIRSRKNSQVLIIHPESVLHENDSGVGQLAVRLTGEVKKRLFVNDLPVKNTLISRSQGKFLAKIHQQADGLQNREVLRIVNTSRYKKNFFF